MIWDSVTIGYVGLRGVNKPLASLNNHLINEIKNEAGSCHEHWSWRANKLEETNFEPNPVVQFIFLIFLFHWWVILSPAHLLFWVLIFASCIRQRPTICLWKRENYQVHNLSHYHHHPSHQLWHTQPCIFLVHLRPRYPISPWAPSTLLLSNKIDSLNMIFFFKGY